MNIIKNSVITVLVIACVILAMITAIQHHQMKEIIKQVNKNTEATKLDAEMTVFLAKDYVKFKQRIIQNEKDQRNRFSI